MMRMGYLKKQLTAANRSEVLPKPARGAEERYAAVTGLHKTQNIKKKQNKKNVENVLHGARKVFYLCFIFPARRFLAVTYNDT